MSEAPLTFDVLRGDFTGTGLEIAAPLPSGGLVHVDLLRPLEALSLHVPSGEVVDELPLTWARLATVAAVDRWLEVELDTGLLLADHALARVESGFETHQPEDVDRASAAILDLLSRTSSGLAPAIRAELERMARVAPFLLGDKPAALLAQTESGFVSRRWEARQPAFSGIADFGVVAAAGPGPWTGHLDPQRVPARICYGKVEVGRVNEVATVSVRAVSWMTSGQPGADRLAAAVEVDGVITSVMPMWLDADGRFRTRLPAADVPGLPLIEVFDVLAPPAGRPLVERLGRIGFLQNSKGCWGTIREAGALAALGYDELAQTCLRHAAGSLDVARKLVTGDRALRWLRDDVARDLQVKRLPTPFLSDATRPGLSELWAWST